MNHTLLFARHWWILVKNNLPLEWENNKNSLSSFSFHINILKPKVACQETNLFIHSDWIMVDHDNPDHQILPVCEYYCLAPQSWQKLKHKSIVKEY